MGFFDTFFDRDVSSATQQSADSGTSFLDSFFGAGSNPAHQPAGSTISYAGRHYQNRDDALRDIDARSLDGSLGCKCPQCGYYCGSRAALLLHLERSHSYGR